MFTHTISPVLLSIGPFTIFWYGFLFLLATLITFFFARKLLTEQNILAKKDADELAFLVILGAVIGARIGSVLSELSYYLSNPLDVFAFWNGGLAFHGGLVGGIFLGWLFLRKKKVNFLSTAGLLSIPVPLALAIGRVGNFINAEFYGTVTSLPWGVLFPEIAGVRHPVQLYESAAYLLLFVLLFFLYKKQIQNTFLLAWFMIGYALIRFLLEFVKELPDFFIALTWGQFWSVPMFFVGVYLLTKQKINKEVKKP